MRADWERQELEREAFERRRQRRTWLIAFGVVPVLVTIGLVASGVLRVDRYFKLDEGRQLIHTVASTQLAFREAHGRWATRFSELGLEPGEHFTCLLSKDERLLPTAAEAIAVASSELPALVDELELGVTCETQCDYLAACASRWPWNDLMTVWFVTSRALPDGSRRANVPFSPGAIP